MHVCHQWFSYTMHALSYNYMHTYCIAIPEALLISKISSVFIIMTSVFLPACLSSSTGDAAARATKHKIVERQLFTPNIASQLYSG